jgi:DNA-binding phage protein
MALTRDFKQTIVALVKIDPVLAKSLLDEAETLVVNGEADTAKRMLRDLVKATVGFEQLAQTVAKPTKNVHRKLSPSGNPTMTNLTAIFAALIASMKVEFRALSAHSR